MILVGIELLTEYILGTLFVKIVLKKEGNIGMNLLIGFLSEQALFQVLCFLITANSGILHHLTMVWEIGKIILLVISVLACHKIIRKQWEWLLGIMKANKAMTILVLFVIFAFWWYVAINGERNDDADYYIALMTTTVDTDSLFKYNAYTGMELDSLYFRRLFVTFEIHSAVLCQLTRLHPLIFSRIIRAGQNVWLTSIAVMLCADALFFKENKKRVEKTMLCCILFWMIQPMLANTIYTPATFLLYRAYEAKAFTANGIILIGLYLCVKMWEERNGTYFILLAIYLWGSLALSTSAFVVAFALCSLLLIPIGIQKIIYKQKKDW